MSGSDHGAIARDEVGPGPLMGPDSLVAYLESRPAADDVRTLLAKWERDVWPNGCDYWTAPPAGAMWSVQQAFRWVKVSVSLGSDPVHVYFHRDPEYFKVSDLGEGVRHLEMASGCLYYTEEQREAVSALFRPSRNPGDRVERLRVTAHGLADAICSALAQSIRLAQLANDPRFAPNPSNQEG